MADISTNLRELSVAFFLISPSKYFPSINPQLFTEFCNKHIENCNIDITHISSNNIKFNSDALAILKNGFNLAVKLRETLGINGIKNIQWVGNLTQSDSPVDLIVNDYKLSLKEESYILENMGLYKLLNIISNSEDHPRGLHVFETFAKRDLFTWYETTRDLLIKLGPSRFIHNGSGYFSEGILKDNKLTLNYNNTSISKINNFSESTYADFKSRTNSKTRERVFSKWIREKISQSPIYVKAKSNCSQAAGDKIVSIYGKYIGSSNIQLLRLFRIHDYTYYYSKTTSTSVQIFQVPTIQDSLNKIIINNFYHSVPDSQLNIITEILNTQNNKTFSFRNELRYSHGQFNGTPEAKLYHERGADLSIMYNVLSR